MQTLEKLIETLTLPSLLARRAQEFSDKIFVNVGGNALTYSELDEKTDRVASGLRALGVNKADRVALIMENRIEYLLSFFALSKLGAIVVPVNVYMKGEFLVHQLKDSNTSLVIADRSGTKSVLALKGELQDLRVVIGVDELDGESGDLVPFSSLLESSAVPLEVEIKCSDLLAISYTSGTTGMPKGCMLSHGYYTGIPKIFFNNNWFQETDVMYTAFSMYHVSGGLLTLMSVLQGGMSIHYADGFSASKFIESAREAKATIVWGVGAMGMAVLASPPKEEDRQHDIRLAIWIPMDPSSQVAFEERFGVKVLSSAYGQTEMAAIASVDPSKENDRAIAGYPASVVEVSLVDEEDNAVPCGEVGEIVIRPNEPNVMFSGYWNNPQATCETFRNLWHHTGDYATMSEDGAIIFVDRKKDAIRRRGVNVSSMQVESTIVRHPSVSKVAVHAVPSSLGEDDIKVCLVPEEGASIDYKAIFEFFKDNLPYYAVPRYVEILDELPTNAMGRVMKHLLREKGAGKAIDLVDLGLVVEKRDRRSGS